jgi:hypothetical protein
MRCTESPLARTANAEHDPLQRDMHIGPIVWTFTLPANPDLNIVIRPRRT